MSPHYRALNGSSHPFTTPEDKPIALLIQAKTIDSVATLVSIVQQPKAGEPLSEMIANLEDSLYSSGLIPISFQIVPTISSEEFE